MKAKNIFWGIGLIAVAILIILNALGTSLGIIAGISVVKIVIGALCIAWIVKTIVSREWNAIFFPLAIIFITFEDKIASLIGASGTGLINNWLVLLAALLLCCGTSLIMSHHLNHCEDKNECHINIGMDKSTRYIDCTDFVNQSIDIDMSGCDIYFENIENYSGNGTLYIDNDMAKTVVHIPSEWHIISNISNIMGKVSIPSNGNPDGKIININGQNDMGVLSVELV